jgi:uncharacterized protein YkwD
MKLIVCALGALLTVAGVVTATANSSGPVHDGPRDAAVGASRGEVKPSAFAGLEPGMSAAPATTAEGSATAPPATGPKHSALASTHAPSPEHTGEAPPEAPQATGREIVPPATVARPDPPPPPPPPPEPPEPPPPSMGDLEAAIVALTNADRSAAGLGPLSVDGCLAGIARSWAGVMADVGSMLHNGGFDGCGRMEWGENVAVWEPCSPAAIQDAWMASASHRDNILYGGFNRIGVGTAMIGEKCYVTVDFAA